MPSFKPASNLSGAFSPGREANVFAGEDENAFSIAKEELLLVAKKFLDGITSSGLKSHSRCYRSHEYTCKSDVSRTQGIDHQVACLCHSGDDELSVGER